ncbi:MAG TPA: hypothetical protein VFB96_23405 [Pirellulaceae bacterium]|jgi:hypothetical protein|nr:hypothetical protein [Pirellulaceae bacterium]
MGWVNDALRELSSGRQVQVRPIGGSMRGRIESGQLVTLAPASAADVAIDDVVFVRWRGNHLLHLVKEIRSGEYLIGNNVGKTNGWVAADAIVGKVVSIGERLTEQVGVVEGITKSSGLQFQIRLPDGSVIRARVPRKLGCIFGTMAGTKVRVSALSDGRYRVEGIEKDPA